MQIQVSLTGIPETMVWTLYNRASEVRRPDGVLDDPDCVRVFETLEYDYEYNFGKEENGLHGRKSRVFDTTVKAWLADHPDGTVVELGAGLETQFQRLDNGTVSWLCVDLPEAIALREQVLPAGARCRYIAADAFDMTWFDHVNPGPVLITAQSLLMFFPEEQVRQLIVAIVDQRPGVEMVFDTISPVVSEKAAQGYNPTGHYRFPSMPWGIKRNSIAPLLRRWHGGITDVTVSNFGPAHGFLAAITPLCARLPVSRDLPPALVHVKTAASHR